MTKVCRGSLAYMASLGSPRIDSGATAVSISVTMVVAGPSHGAQSVTSQRRRMECSMSAGRGLCMPTSISGRRRRYWPLWCRILLEAVTAVNHGKMSPAGGGPTRLGAGARRLTAWPLCHSDGRPKRSRGDAVYRRRQSRSAQPGTASINLAPPSVHMRLVIIHLLHAPHAEKRKHESAETRNIHTLAAWRSG